MEIPKPITRFDIGVLTGLMLVALMGFLSIGTYPLIVAGIYALFAVAIK